MILKKNFLLLILFLSVVSVHKVTAQQDAQYTQYMFNTLSVNPAYAGSRGELSIAALYRSQWVGLDGAPETFTLSLNSPIRNSKLGYGVSIVQDNIGDGAISETFIDAVVSYTIDVSLKAKLSFGLKAGGNLLNLDFNNLRNFDVEPVDADNIENRFSPNIGLGIYYHADRFYAGLSAPNLFQTEHFDNSLTNSNSISFLSQERINYFLITGYVFDIGNDFKFKPALLTKVVGGAPLQVDVSANFLYNDKFSFGAAYRWDAAVSALAGFQISDQVMLGLAYDREITELGGTQFNDGSFEVFLRFELVKSFQKLVSPRFF